MTPLKRFYDTRRSVAGRTIAGLLTLFLLLIPLSSCGTPSVLQFTNVDPGIPADAMNAPVAGPLADATILHVRITFKIDPNLLKQAQQQKIEPGKPSHLDQLASKIGIDDATYQKIKTFFSPTSAALKLSTLRTHLAIDAKAGSFAKVFQTKFVVHKYNGRTFYAPATPARIPQFMANSIDAITGLDNYSSPPQHDFSMSFHSPAALRRPTQDCSPLDQTLLPKEVASAYSFNQLWNRGWHGENMTINLVEIDGSYRSDVQNYLDCIQFKGKLSTVDVDGSPQQALGESTLDIQMVAGLARSAHIVVYQTDASGNGDPWVNVNDELQQLANDNVNNANAGGVVSISLGAAEGDISSADMRAMNSSLQQLTQIEHMTVFTASGDCGAFTSGVYGKLGVSFPASSPWAVAVGGTILQIDNNSNRANEMVWSDGSKRSNCGNRWGSGGGNSAMFKHTDWQSAPGISNRYTTGTRQLPDVSAVAYALAVYFNGQWGAVGGTSAAAPIWATGLALVNEGLIQQVHRFNSDTSPRIFYNVNAQSRGMHPYFDVTRGNNLYYPATSGWDYATGLGTPNLADFYQVTSRNVV